MSLCDIQARLRDHNPAYPDMFTWKQEGNTVKAVPRKYPSNLLDATMRKAGFKHVSHNGQSWYEYALEPVAVVSGCVQATRLRDAAEEWLEEEKKQ